MKITILAVGMLKEKYLRDGVAEYLKRLATFAKIECIEIAEEKMPENFSPAEKEKTLAREGERLLARVPEGSELVVLDVAGEPLYVYLSSGSAPRRPMIITLLSMSTPLFRKVLFQCLKRRFKPVAEPVRGARIPCRQGVLDLLFQARRLAYAGPHLLLARL